MTTKPACPRAGAASPRYLSFLASPRTSHCCLLGLLASPGTSRYTRTKKGGVGSRGWRTSSGSMRWWRHQEELSPPPSFPPHAPPQAQWLGKMVPSPSSLQQQEPPMYPAGLAAAGAAGVDPMAPRYLEYPAWPHHGPWTLPPVVGLTQDKDKDEQ
jgi:hypothetical protein